MKLIIQIPCLNEREHLPAAFADLPRSIAGVDVIEVLIIDDGSTDGTSELAESLGVHHIVRFPKNRGLAAAYAAGIEAATRLGADIIVNTDADNQYFGADIARLVEPILKGEADVVIGDRKTDTIQHFSPIKKVLQKLGSSVVRKFSGTTAQDTTSGFRAVSRKAALKIFVHNRFTYTLETIIQAGQLGLPIANVVIRTNPKARESRLFKSIPNYIRRNGLVILRSYAMYSPVKTFGMIGGVLLLLGAGLCGRFLYFFLIAEPGRSGRVQSLLVGVGAIVLSFVVFLCAALSDLLAANRRLLEEAVGRLRQIEAAVVTDHPGVRTTGAASWRP